MLCFGEKNYRVQANRQSHVLTFFFVIGIIQNTQKLWGTSNKLEFKQERWEKISDNSDTEEALQYTTKENEEN